jgi:hypothetical protein
LALTMRAATSGAIPRAGFLAPDQLGLVATLPAEIAERVVSILGPIIVTLGASAGPDAVRVAVTGVLDAYQPQAHGAAAAPSVEPAAGVLTTDASVVVPAGATADVVSRAEAAPGSGSEQDTVKEFIVLCIDKSGSMQTPFECDNDHRTKDRTRLESVKQIFYGFRDQTGTYVDGAQHRLGLLSYDHQVRIFVNPNHLWCRSCHIIQRAHANTRMAPTHPLTHTLCVCGTPGDGAHRAHEQS